MQFLFKRLLVYNTILLLDQSAQHLQLSDLTLASLQYDPGLYACLFIVEEQTMREITVQSLHI